VTERLGPKVELALLVRHEAGCCKETGPDAHRSEEETGVNLRKGTEESKEKEKKGTEKKEEGKKEKRTDVYEEEQLINKSKHDRLRR